MRKHFHKIRWAGVNIARLLLASAFIVSGFVKAVDPRGTQYKIEDYLQVFGWEDMFPSFFPLVGAVLLCALEFCLGIYLLFGIRRRRTSRVTLLFMCLVTPFTLYLALADPVADCGCFGDAWILTNWQTFGKNVVLLMATVLVSRHWRRMSRLISERNQWMISMYSILFISFFASYCIYRLPFMDFRPYYIGADLKTAVEGGEAQYETVFILEKDGETKEFSLENYPDSTWTFIDSRTVAVGSDKDADARDFSISLLPVQEDITTSVLQDESYVFLLVAPRLEHADDSYIDRINVLYDYCVEHGYAFYCLTASDETAISRWEELTGAEYPFCFTDELALKTMVRSNPGLILLKEGVVLNKWSCTNFPSEDELSDPLEKLPLANLVPEDYYMKIINVLLWFFVPFIILTFADRIWMGGKMYKRFKHKNKIINQLKERKNYEKENRSR